MYQISDNINEFFLDFFLSKLFQIYNGVYFFNLWIEKGKRKNTFSISTLQFFGEVFE